MKKNLLPEIDGKPYYDDILDRCDVGFCDKNDYPEIAEFLDKYWRKGHVFTKSKVLDVYKRQIFDNVCRDIR